jgi:beta-1,4-mannosyltransferase
VKGFLPVYDPPYSSAFTATNSGVKAPFLREDRPALLVSSTFWTPDEDFSILLAALGEYNQAASSPSKKLPKLLVILTGKGPLREKYMTEVGEIQKRWDWVRCVSMWLDAEDYPTLLGIRFLSSSVASCLTPLAGAADLGISLHASSSNLNLPMKVVDMFGCTLPVCALDFSWLVDDHLASSARAYRIESSSLNELVKDGKNGLVFKNASQLAQQMEASHCSFLPPV